MDKNLPVLMNDSIVKEYMSLLLNGGYKKEFDDTKDLVEYIQQMEIQNENIYNELSEVKELLRNLQNPTTKSALSTAVNKVEQLANDGKNKVYHAKEELISSMKNSVETFRKKGKDGIVKTIDILHFKEMLGGIRKSLFLSLRQMDNTISRCDQLTAEVRRTKHHFRNVFDIMRTGKIQSHNPDLNKLNRIQRGTRSVRRTVETMIGKTTNILHKLEDFEKSSVKGEIRMLENKTSEPKTNTHKDLEVR